MEVVGKFFGLVVVLVPPQFVSRNNDFLLSLRQCCRIILLTTAATTSAALLALEVLLTEWPDLNKIHIRLDRIRRIGRVHSLAKIGDKVTKLQARILQGRMCEFTGDFLLSATLILVQINCFLRTSIDGKMQFQFIDAVIILGAQLP